MSSVISRHMCAFEAPAAQTQACPRCKCTCLGQTASRGVQQSSQQEEHGTTRSLEHPMPLPAFPTAPRLAAAQQSGLVAHTAAVAVATPPNKLPQPSLSCVSHCLQEQRIEEEADEQALMLSRMLTLQDPFQGFPFTTMPGGWCKREANCRLTAWRHSLASLFDLVPSIVSLGTHTLLPPAR